jgi:hypothetical protein
MNWEPDTFINMGRSPDIEDFLWEMIPKNDCNNYDPEE